VTVGLDGFDVSLFFVGKSHGKAAILREALLLCRLFWPEFRF
jgi:hypothetical protein